MLTLLGTLRVAEVNKPHLKIRSPFHYWVISWTVALPLRPVVKGQEAVTRHLVK